MPVCVPITELRNTNKFTELVKNSKQPVTVTKNGYAEFVVIDAKHFDEYASKSAETELRNVIKQMESDRAKKDFVDAHDYINDLKEKNEL